jgi:endonuclease-3
MDHDTRLAARLKKALAILGPLWPEAVPLLEHRSCFELLSAVMLSAQCTDEQVNRVTPLLFARWPDSARMAGADVAEVETVIHSVGFYRTKARHLVDMAGLLVGRHGGQVPDSMEALLELPGVGRKTANLVLSSCFGSPGIIVDTHVLRVARRFGICDRADPGLVEKRIAGHLPEADWTRFSHAVNRHGKHVCRARKPDCAGCPLAKLCPRIGVAG